MTARSTAMIATAVACLLAGCADGSLNSAFNTGSIDPQKQAANEQAEKSKQALCNTLVSQIDALNTEGVSDKVSKAAAKKYKLKSTDLNKADELNKANTEFQAKCSSYPPRVATTAPIEPVATSAVTTGSIATAKAKPPVPTQKPIAAAMAPQTTTQASNTSSTTDGGMTPTP
ncbi:MAG: hypothetical protein WC829_13265 [Hyphomicrobium sp.]|jgi:hypothetical protein